MASPAPPGPAPVGVVAIGASADGAEELTSRVANPPEVPAEHQAARKR